MTINYSNLEKGRFGTTQKMIQFPLSRIRPRDVILTEQMFYAIKYHPMFQQKLSSYLFPVSVPVDRIAQIVLSKENMPKKMSAILNLNSTMRSRVNPFENTYQIRNLANRVAENSLRSVDKAAQTNFLRKNTLR